MNNDLMVKTISSDNKIDYVDNRDSWIMLSHFIKRFDPFYGILVLCRAINFHFPPAFIQT
jgi:hypothetical protein